MAWVDDDGTAIEVDREEPATDDEIREMQERAESEHARDLEEAGRVADMVIAPGRSPEPGAPIGTVADAVMAAVIDAVLPVVKSQAESLRLTSKALEQTLRVVQEHEQRLARLEQFAFGAGFVMEPSVLDGDAREDLDRPLTPAEDKARAAEIARIAKLDAAETEAADLRGIDQAAPDAPLPPPPPVEDEVVIPVRGPKSGFR